MKAAAKTRFLAIPSTGVARGVGLPSLAVVEPVSHTVDPRKHPAEPMRFEPGTRGQTAVPRIERCRSR